MDQIGAKVDRAKWASILSRHAIAAAQDDLEGHQRWLDRHRAAWAEEIKLYERRLKSKSQNEAVKRLALGALLIVPITCLAVLRLTVQVLPWARDLLRSVRNLVCVVSSAHARARSLRSAKSHDSLHHTGRIAGLDGLLCTGQPSPANVVTKPGTGLLSARLVVGSLGAIIVGFLVAASTFGTPRQATEVPPKGTQLSGPTSPLLKRVDQLAPDPILGFAVVATAPAEQKISHPGMTISEMVSLTRPWPVSTSQTETALETFEVTLPTRKPKAKVRVKSKRSPTKQTRHVTFWEQLKWLP